MLVHRYIGRQPAVTFPRKQCIRRVKSKSDKGAGGKVQEHRVFAGICRASFRWLPLPFC